MPFIASAIVVVGCCAALVIDRLWIDMAQVELRCVAEASALAALRQYWSDGSIKKNVNNLELVEEAKHKAVSIAAENLVAGEPLQLNDSAEGDIHFGQLILSEEDVVMFAETDSDPYAVVVMASRTRMNGNPLGLFFRQITGQPVGDASETAEAVADSRVTGLSPINGMAIPALPIAIQEKEFAPQLLASWDSLIEQKKGLDNYGYDHVHNKVTHEPDGIVEIVVHSQPTDEDEPEFNGILIDIGSGFEDEAFASQIQNGLTLEDLKHSDVELNFTGDRIPAHGNAFIHGKHVDEFKKIIGEQRIIFLYQTLVPKNDPLGNVKVTLGAPVAGRIMAVRLIDGKQTEFVIQPTVIATKTAMNPALPIWAGQGAESKNKYIYNLKLNQ